MKNQSFGMQISFWCRKMVTNGCRFPWKKSGWEGLGSPPRSPPRSNLPDAWWHRKSHQLLGCPHFRIWNHEIPEARIEKNPAVISDTVFEIFWRISRTPEIHVKIWVNSIPETRTSLPQYVSADHFLLRFSDELRTCKMHWSRQRPACHVPSCCA